ncbi:MAG: GntR family transcriptional regulator [Actinophytocola sp.]|nr:GntR family transcriptional regulator [Actinophytocola sp.]
MAFRRPPTAQEAVLNELRRAIVSGELVPGQQIVQDVVAERLGVSRVPVREALKILEGEGQVTEILVRAAEDLVARYEHHPDEYERKYARRLRELVALLNEEITKRQSGD